MVERPVIYIIDDDEAARDSLIILLEMNGFSAQGFARADEFLHQGVRPMACLLLDLHMPGMSGLDLLKLSRGRGITSPIITISGGSDAALVAEVRLAGATAVLYKPFEEGRLIALINEAVPSRTN